MKHAKLSTKLHKLNTGKQRPCAVAVQELNDVSTMGSLTAIDPCATADDSNGRDAGLCSMQQLLPSHSHQFSQVEAASGRSLSKQTRQCSLCQATHCALQSTVNRAAPHGIFRHSHFQSATFKAKRVLGGAASRTQSESLPGVIDKWNRASLQGATGLQLKHPINKTCESVEASASSMNSLCGVVPLMSRYEQESASETFRHRSAGDLTAAASRMVLPSVDDLTDLSMALFRRSNCPTAWQLCEISPLATPTSGQATMTEELHSANGANQRKGHDVLVDSHATAFCAVMPNAFWLAVGKQQEPSNVAGSIDIDSLPDCCTAKDTLAHGLSHKVLGNQSSLSPTGAIKNALCSLKESSDGLVEGGCNQDEAAPAQSTAPCVHVHRQKSLPASFMGHSSPYKPLSRFKDAQQASQSVGFSIHSRRDTVNATAETVCFAQLTRVFMSTAGWHQSAETVDWEQFLNTLGFRFAYLCRACSCELDCHAITSEAGCPVVQHPPRTRILVRRLSTSTAEVSVHPNDASKRPPAARAGAHALPEWVVLQALLSPGWQFHLQLLHGPLRRAFRSRKHLQTKPASMMFAHVVEVNSSPGWSPETAPARAAAEYFSTNAVADKSGQLPSIASRPPAPKYGLSAALKEKLQTKQSTVAHAASAEVARLSSLGFAPASAIADEKKWWLERTFCQAADAALHADASVRLLSDIPSKQRVLNFPVLQLGEQQYFPCSAAVQKLLLSPAHLAVAIRPPTEWGAVFFTPQQETVLYTAIQTSLALDAQKAQRWKQPASWGPQESARQLPAPLTRHSVAGPVTKVPTAPCQLTNSDHPRQQDPQ